MEKIVSKSYRSYMSFKPFTEAEAWMLFRIAAIGEAVGWTLLIIGVLCRNLPVSWNEMPVQYAGHIHGILFLIYIVAVLVLSPSLGWSWFRILVAGACSVPPYGSLAYEQWSAQHRNLRSFKVLQKLLVYKRLSIELRP